MKERKPILYQEDIEKIKFFDILVDDMHSAGEGSKPHTIDSTVALTYHEVWEWISEGGDWIFEIVEHNNHSNVFMRGSTYQDMNSARKGQQDCVLSFATDAEMSDIRKLLSKKIDS